MLSRMTMIAAAGAMALTPAFADAPAGPLAPGKAAGVTEAQTDTQTNRLAVFGAIGLAAVGVYLIVGTHYNNPGNGQKSQGSSGTH
ncbi:MAG TPA: hypothetical protein VG867_01095 [Rhizomicrobium sp.]|nr:hypothetical protein [Rhizomicrobium sp.]